MFDFDIEHIAGQYNSLPDFLSLEFLQGSGPMVWAEKLRKTKCKEEKDDLLQAEDKDMEIYLQSLGKQLDSHQQAVVKEEA